MSSTFNKNSSSSPVGLRQGKSKNFPDVFKNNFLSVFNSIKFGKFFLQIFLHIFNIFNGSVKKECHSFVSFELKRNDTILQLLSFAIFMKLSNSDCNLVCINSFIKII